MKRIVIPAVFFLLTYVLLSMIPNCFAVDEEYSDEIDRIEHGNNTTTTYFKNGTKLVELCLSAVFNIRFETTATTTKLQPVTYPIDVFKMIDIVLRIASMIVALLGLFGITIYKKSKKKLEYVRHLGRSIEKRARPRKV